MNTITNVNIKDYCVTGAWTINGSMKADKDSTEPKSFTLNVRFNNVSVLDIINKSLDPTKIQWVNGPGRTKYESWVKGQTVNIDFKSPGRIQTDPVADVIGRAKAMDKAERVAYLKNILDQCEVEDELDEDVDET